MGSDAHAHHDAQGHHVSSLPDYFKIFGALVVLTVITVGVSRIGLPQPLSLIVAIAVAAVKATLVAMYFMHLKYDDKFNAMVLVGSIAFLSLFFLFTLVDLDTRDSLIQEQQNFSYQDDAAWQTKMTDEAAPAPPAVAPDPMEYLKGAKPAK